MPHGYLAVNLRFGVGKALLSQSGIHLIILIKIIIYTQYFSIAYCFIMYYYSEVQILFALSSINSM